MVRRPLEVSLGHLQGRQVSLALADGTRIDDCQLISAGSGAVAWLFWNGADRFVPRSEIVAAWEFGRY
jgi:hypothetical protein